MCTSAHPPLYSATVHHILNILTFSWLRLSHSSDFTTATTATTTTTTTATTGGVESEYPMMEPRVEEDNIVCTWLRFLRVEEYCDNFLDNGYDDLETVKRIKLEDLRAIGINNPEDEEIILLSVKILREQGAAWVYFLCGGGEADPKLSVSRSSVSTATPTSTPCSRLGGVEELSVCENIYCDIADTEVGDQDLGAATQPGSWAEFWRKLFYSKRKRRNVIKRGAVPLFMMYGRL